MTLPSRRTPSSIRLVAAALCAIAGAAAAAASGVLVIPGAEDPAAAALVYWTAPLPGSALPAPAANRPQTQPLSLRPYAGDGEPVKYALVDHSAIQVPAGTWMITIRCVARQNHSVGETQFRFEAGKTYLLQCGGSPRRIQQPRATEVEVPAAVSPR